MDHPNIARIIDGDATGSGWPYFVIRTGDVQLGNATVSGCNSHSRRELAPTLDVVCTPVCTESIESDLDRLIAAWPSLSPALRLSILAMIDVAKKD
jgi:hypothetical protein